MQATFWPTNVTLSRPTRNETRLVRLLGLISFFSIFFKFKIREKFNQLIILKRALKKSTDSDESKTWLCNGNMFMCFSKKQASFLVEKGS